MFGLSRFPGYFFIVCIYLRKYESNGATLPENPGNKSLTIGYLLSWSHEWAAGPYIGSSIEVAIREIHRRQLLPGYDINWILEDTWCQAGQGIKAATEVWFKATDLDVFIGPGCSVVCLPVSLLATTWNIPVISYGCSSDLLSDKATYPTFSRTVGLYTQVAYILHDLSKVFQWRNVGIVTDSADLFLRMSQQLEIMLKASGTKTHLYIAESTHTGSDKEERLQKLRQVMRLLRSSCRIIYVAMYTQDVRNLLAIAHEENMLKGFVYMGAEVEPPYGDYKFYRPDLGAEIYEGVIDLEVSVPEGPSWDSFRQEIIDSFQSPKFDGWEHVGPDASIEVVNNYAGMIHDAVLLWAYGVNATLAQGRAPDDGAEVLNNMVNRTFVGITGSVTIDERGDRKSDYIARMQQNGSMVPILHYVALVSKFLKLYKPNDKQDWSGIIWPGGHPEVPRDSPECGWRMELCQVEEGFSKSSLAAIIIAVVLLIAFILVASLVGLSRKYRFEKSLQEAASCLISWSEIHEGHLKDHSSAISLVSSQSCGTINIQQEFCSTVRYKSEVFSVKLLENTKINITDRQVLLELKLMRDIHHENVNPFKGICLDASQACILMLYAPRGSLQDVIESSHSLLSWEFKLSLAMDIARGMGAIHASFPGWHGHLTSSNCLIDSRWVCKITDYGLHSIRYGQGGSTRVLPPDDLQWTAPELLEQDSHIPGTKMADVYSYGIIIQEIVLQSFPYSENGVEMSAEIVKRVAERRNPPFRPVLLKGCCNADWRTLMTSCWTDDPNSRPTFSQIRSMLIQINGGQETSLVDSMIQRLELHSTKLETIVAQRTLELLEEKDRVEHLLMELLPRSITESLKLGRKVAPETFESVTIFFSDVVSFTRISAAGTPLDVVRMLNLMYTLFDDIAENYDAYKVATIGDAYFVASGVPIRNGNQHASEICKMAQQLLRSVSSLYIPHLPDESLKLRIGIHTGQCLAGVVGVKMPRYLLFGDTVDIASQMESSGRCMQIQVSQSTAAILPKESFTLEKRQDPVEIKGYGEMTSYWLVT